MRLAKQQAEQAAAAKAAAKKHAAAAMAAAKAAEAAAKEAAEEALLDTELAPPLRLTSTRASRISQRPRPLYKPQGSTRRRKQRRRRATSLSPHSAGRR